MAGRLDGKVALITGGASGIGEGTVRRFVAEGARCVIADIQPDPLAALAAELGDAVRIAGADVTVEADIAAAVDLAVAAFGHLDVMFNNAGIVGATGTLVDTTVEAWDATIAVLLRGVFLGTKHAARVMVPQGSGVILSMSSTAGVMGGLGPHAYTAAKHAVIGLTRSAASELAQFGIRVNAIGAGNIVTPMTAAVITGDPGATDTTHTMIEAMSPLRRAGVPADIAAAAVYLASDDSLYVSGHCLMVDAAQTTGPAPSMFSQGEAGMLREAGRRGL
ncbi:MAG: SDR family oxidoreductase [Actinomycetota bacterium]|nr:SDR family oxidoreductase [Actinomycetota bacterium]